MNVEDNILSFGVKQIWFLQPGDPNSVKLSLTIFKPVIIILHTTQSSFED